MKPRHTLNMELRSANQNHLSKSNDNSRKPLPRKSIKRPAQSESKKEIDEKLLKLGEATQSSNAVVNDAKVDPGSSNEKQSSINIQDNQPMECAQAEETAAASNGDKNTEARSQSLRTEQNEKVSSSPVKDVDEVPTEVINIDNDDHSQGVKKPDQNNYMNQSHSTSNTMTAAKPSTSAEQTTLPNQHNNQEHIPNSGNSLSQIDNVRSLANVHDDHKLHVNKVSRNEPFMNHLSRDTIDSLPARYMDGARRLVPVREPVEITWPISRNFPQQRQSQPNQQDLHRQPQRPKIRIGITIKRKDIRQMPTLQGVTKQTRRQALSATHNNLMLSQLQLQPRPSAQSTEDNNIALTTKPQSNNSMQRETQPATQSSEERHTEVTASASSSDHNQQSNDVLNKPPEKQHKNIWRFVLPPEYDPNDTRWTLKYRKKLPGLIELVPQSRIYVSYGDLKYCQYVSKDCKSLARRLLSKVFSRQALSVCLTMSEKAQAPNKVGSNIRPELDEQASTVLLNFVLEHGLQCRWNTDLKPILSTLDTKIKEIRYKYGVMVKS